ncbi:MAG: HAMP domain-containing sensor histidine kinase [Ferruginibacter sp.]
MKLLSKYFRSNITGTIVVVLLTSICYYFVIRYILIEQLDNALVEEEQEVMEYVKQHNSLPLPSSYKDQEVDFKTGSQHSVRRFITTDLYGQDTHELIATRQLISPINLNGQTIDVFIKRSEQETEELIQLIALITLVAVVLLLLVLFLINRFVLQRLWKPFNTTLSQLKDFHLLDKNTIRLEESEINEFNELNKAVMIMTKHVQQEYNSLKSFTENASHEMQTPLAIINSKLDLLIQGENINELQMHQLQDIYNALDRLSKMNHSLLLMTKIENNQFAETENVQLDILMKEKLFQFEELVVNRDLAIEINTDPVRIPCNKQLMDILLTNLLNNAIRYNINGGTISIKVTGKTLVISNSSELPSLDDQRVFQRFYRPQENKQEGNGLGLSIVKQICDRMGFSVQYFSRENNYHEFQVDF